MTENALADVRRWVEEFVVGEGLCPFAGDTFHKTRFLLSPHRDVAGLLVEFEAALNQLLDPHESAPESTLLIVPNMLEAFGDYLDALALLDATLAEAGLEGIVQIASLHPQYCFQGTNPDQLSNYTNRSPWPVFHLLKEASVSRAIDGFPDVEAIPIRNIAHLESLGPARVHWFARRE